MSKKLAQPVLDNLEKCRSAAIAAVDVYNRPGPRFRTATYIVLIVLAWTALFHARFYRAKQKPWYKKAGATKQGDRFQRIDGEPKHWDLTECLKQHYGGTSPPERKNLEFLIGLRNKIEHRHLPELDAALFGECQAALLNLEDVVDEEFGAKYSLLEQLAVSLQMSRSMPSEKKAAARKLASSAVKSVREYVTVFRGGLPSSTLNSTKYSFNVFLIPKIVGREKLADSTVEFIKYDELDKGERERLERLNVLVKERHIPIANCDLYKPSEIVDRVSEALPHRFTMTAHTNARVHFGVRPASGAEKPTETISQFCVYDPAHNDYLYTEAWIDKLVRELSPPEGFKSVVGKYPVPKQ